MSRSYNKQGLWKDHCRAGSAKGWKKLANRKFRRTFSLDSTRDRQHYRKCTRMSWDIHDYKRTTTENEARKFYRTYVDTSYWLSQFEDEDDYINRDWKKSIRK